MTNAFGANKISLAVALLPIAVLLGGLAAVIILRGPLATADMAPWILLIASAAGLAAARARGGLEMRSMRVGFLRSASQVLPAVPILACIALLSTTWMTSGAVPLLIDYGMALLHPSWFLAAVCAICAVVSVVTGSSWSTVATIGVAFIGIGTALGQHPGWTAGAVISGAYFGDKMSPMSDTTVVASATCGVDLFRHIRYMMLTTLPAMVVALVVFAARGLAAERSAPVSSTLGAELNAAFNLSPWLLTLPALTMVLLILRVHTALTLGISALAGAAATLIFQPGGSVGAADLPRVMFSGFTPGYSSETVNELTATGGLLGILPVIWLILCALVFGSVMIGTGMISAITDSLAKLVRGRVSAVGASVVTGLTLNAATADQYLSLIINGNMYRTLFRRNRLEPRLLSRSIEDSISATSPLIPWSSCGVTQASVLGVATMTYLPYCVFNYLTPLMALLVAWTGWRIRRT
ncbi:MAG: sodium:proton antiporter [Muribaculaceae bacterium]|nr:sodium:proton antiporter [Muribaculaceae bacterium]